MSNENFFKHDDKAYAENLNDAILIANAFDYQVPVNIPGMYGNNHYPNDNNIHKVGVADVTIISSGSLSIGDTAITNNSNTSQVLRLRVYPNFNSFYAWKKLNWTCTGAVTVNICDAGTSTSLLPSGALTNPDNETLLNGISNLQGLKEYDLLITIPVNGVLNTLSLVFVNNWNSQNRVSASISQGNVTGLVSDLSGIRDDLSSLESGKANVSHNHTLTDVVSNEAFPNIGTGIGDSQRVINKKVDGAIGSLSTSITNIGEYTTYLDNANYTVKYNDYKVIIDVHMSSTSFPPTLSNFGADVIPSDCLPSQPVTVPMQNVNAIVSIRDNSQGVWRKSNTGSAITEVSCYCHIEYSRV